MCKDVPQLCLRGINVWLWPFLKGAICKVGLASVTSGGKKHVGDKNISKWRAWKLGKANMVTLIFDTAASFFLQNTGTPFYVN